MSDPKCFHNIVYLIIGAAMTVQDELNSVYDSPNNVIIT